MPYSKKPYIKVINLPDEIWADIEGFENYYQVSNMGRVKSLDRRFTSKSGVSYFFQSRLMKIIFTDRGYATVHLCKECKCKFIRVNILVAKAFLPNPLKLKEVNHLKGIKADNRATELEWTTHQNNMIHSYKVLGTKLPSGETHKFSVPIIAIHPNGKKEEIIGINNAARKLNLFGSAIWRVLEKKQKQHKGFLFEYKQKIA